ncbi:MAG: 3'-5' exonuclease [Verrucomicrobia bacterium]|nr:3'-5' exonuclease [Verrucomicrobiota bacterium]
MKRSLPPITVYDLETTGMSPEYDRIIQIAAAKMIHGQMIPEECFCSYVNPGRRIPAWITQYTGITNEDVKDAPPIESVLAEFSRWSGESVLLAHNGNRFDIKFIQSACCYCGFQPRPVRYCDSMLMSWQLWGRRGMSHGLDAVIERLGVDADGLRRHDARGDALLLGRCVERIFDLYLQANGTLPDLKLKTGFLPDC